MSQINFSNNLKKFRLGQNKLGKKYSQKQVSEGTGISRSLISEYENGIKEPTLTAFVNIAKFFDVSLEELCFEEK